MSHDHMDSQQKPKLKETILKSENEVLFNDIEVSQDSQNENENGEKAQFLLEKIMLNTPKYNYETLQEELEVV